MVNSGSQSLTSRLNAADRWAALGVGVAVLCIILSLRPIIGIPRNDDFSYARTAEALARTSHIAYNGWGSPMMLPQAALGALLIRLFGFSYYVLEWFGVACAGACAATLFILCILSGLNRSSALLVVAVAVANPMYLGTAPSFMTDLPSLLLLLLSFCALVRSLLMVRSEPASAAHLALDRRWFWTSTVLGILAGANRQLSWVVYFGAVVLIFFSLRATRDRVTVAAASAILIASALVASNWLSAQPYTVPTDVYGGLMLLIGYVEAVFAVTYRFFFIFGLFALPVVVASLRWKDIRRPSFWVSIAVVVLPLFFPISKKLGYFTGFYGAAPSGQYFTSEGVRLSYMPGESATMHLIPKPVIYAWTLVGIVMLGMSLYLIIVWCSTTGRKASLKGAGITLKSDSDYLKEVIASSFLASTMLEIIVSIPWFAQLHVFDRYFLFYLPGLAIFFLLQRSLRGKLERDNRPFSSVAKGIAVCSLVAMAILSYAMTATYVNFGRAQAAIYHRLRSKGVPPQQIDNGLEFDGDAQIEIAGHINSTEMLPRSAYDPNAAGRNIPSVTPGMFPVMDAHYIMSTVAHPDIKVLVDDMPVDSESYVSYLPPGRRNIYLLHVSE